MKRFTASYTSARTLVVVTDEAQLATITGGDANAACIGCPGWMPFYSFAGSTSRQEDQIFMDAFEEN